MENAAYKTKNLSLLYPDTESYDRHVNREGVPNISEVVCDELGLNEIFGLKNASLTDFFTSDKNVIEYRQKSLTDMLNVPELGAMLSEIHPILDDIQELRRLDLDRDTSSADSYLYSITEIELYVSVIDKLHSGFCGIRGRLTSPAFSALADFIDELAGS